MADWTRTPGSPHGVRVDIETPRLPAGRQQFTKATYDPDNLFRVKRNIPPAT